LHSILTCIDIYPLVLLQRLLLDQLRAEDRLFILEKLNLPLDKSQAGVAEAKVVILFFFVNLDTHIHKHGVLLAAHLSCLLFQNLEPGLVN